jgi:hypothetical protein
VNPVYENPGITLNGVYTEALNRDSLFSPWYGYRAIPQLADQRSKEAPMSHFRKDRRLATGGRWGVGVAVTPRCLPKLLT